MSKNIFRKSLVLVTIVLFVGANNIVGNPSVLHKEEINVFWEYWDDDHDDGAYSYSDDLGGTAEAKADGDDLWAWIEHSIDWVCPCNVPSSCNPVIYIIYNYNIWLDMDAPSDKNYARLVFTCFVNDIEHKKTEFEYKNSEIDIWPPEKRDYSYEFQMDKLEKGKTYNIGVRADVDTYSWGILGHSWLYIGHEADATDSKIIISWWNRAPEKPDIDGPTNGKVRTSYKYTVKTTDDDNDPIKYMFDWGDGETSGWLGPYNSGQECKASHIWDWEDDFDIKVTAKDDYDVESDGSILTVHMPRNKVVNRPFLLRLFERFPLLERLLSLFRVI